jgi:hypothetical protein
VTIGAYLEESSSLLDLIYPTRVIVPCFEARHWHLVGIFFIGGASYHVLRVSPCIWERC